jgi:coenzyme F420-reducing hydrogenase gamma subunit
MVGAVNQIGTCIGGVIVMKDLDEKSPSLNSDDDLEQDIVRFAAMTELEIDAYLATHGIHAEDTVEAVQKLVREKLDVWRAQGLFPDEVS